jgi:hypothetical protein
MVILLSNSKFYYIAQKNQLFLQWQFVSEIPCNPQTYGMRARYTSKPIRTGNLYYISPLSTEGQLRVALQHDCAKRFWEPANGQWQKSGLQTYAAPRMREDFHAGWFWNQPMRSV